MPENAIQKPVDIVIDETKQQIIDAINQSRLPLSIVEFVLKDVTSMVSSEVGRAKQEYYRTLAQQAPSQPVSGPAEVPGPSSIPAEVQATEATPAQ